MKLEYDDVKETSIGITIEQRGAFFYVQTVDPHGPAFRAGIAQGELLMKFNVGNSRKDWQMWDCLAVHALNYAPTKTVLGIQVQQLKPLEGIFADRKAFITSQRNKRKADPTINYHKRIHDWDRELFKRYKHASSSSPDNPTIANRAPGRSPCESSSPHEPSTPDTNRAPERSSSVDDDVDPTMTSVPKVGRQIFQSVEKSATTPSDKLVGKKRSGVGNSNSLSAKKSKVASNVSVPESSPFHLAIRCSNGSLSTFNEIVKFIEATDGDINDIAVVQLDCMDPTPMHAVVFASHLGYVEIVKSMLENPEVKAAEKKYETICRAYTKQPRVELM